MTLDNHNDPHGQEAVGDWRDGGRPAQVGKADPYPGDVSRDTERGSEGECPPADLGVTDRPGDAVPSQGEDASAGRRHRGQRVYLICDGTNYKIGRSFNPGGRLRQLNGATPATLKLVHTIESDSPSWLEGHLHQRFAAQCVQGEWFLLTQDDITWLCSLSRVDKPPKGTKAPCVGPSGSNSLAEKLKAIREKAGLSQYELAKRAGLSKQAISRLEIESYQTSWETVQRLAKALGIECCAFKDADLTIPGQQPPGQKGRRKKKPPEESADVQT